MITNNILSLIANSSHARNALFARFGGTNVTGAGVTQQIAEACKYPITMECRDYWNLFSREAVAARVVGLLPDECWAHQPEVYETDDPGETKFEAAWAKFASAISLYHYLHRWDLMSGIGHYGVLFFGLDDGKQLHEPVDGVVPLLPGDVPVARTGTPLRVTYLRVFDESTCPVKDWETDLTNPRYGLPRSYNVTLQDTRPNEGVNQGTPLPAGMQTEIHWTRVLHLAEGCTTNEIFGTPRLKPVLNRVLDLVKVLGGSAQMFWLGAFPGFSVETNPELGDVDIDVESLRDTFSNYSRGLDRFVAVPNASIKSLAPSVEDPTNHIVSQYQAIAMQLKCPLRVLLGSEQGVLAAGQDSDSWFARVGHRNDDHVSPKIIVPVAQRLIQYGAVPPAQDILVKHKDLSTPSEEERARVALIKTQALGEYVTKGVEQFIAPKPYLTDVYGANQQEAEGMLQTSRVVDGGLTIPEEPVLPPALPGGGVAPGGAPAPAAGKPPVKPAKKPPVKP